MAGRPGAFREPPLHGATSLPLNLTTTRPIKAKESRFAPVIWSETLERPSLSSFASSSQCGSGITGVQKRSKSCAHTPSQQMGIIRRRASHREPALPPPHYTCTWQHVLQGTPYRDRPLVEKPSIICSLAHQGPKYPMYADAGVLRNVTDVFLPLHVCPTYRPACPGNRLYLFGSRFCSLLDPGKLKSRILHSRYRWPQFVIGRVLVCPGPASQSTFTTQGSRRWAH